MTTLTDLGFASIAAGVLARRRSAVRLLERSQADARSLKRMRMLRSKFGRGPVELVIPGRRFIVVLDPDDVGRVLNEAPTPFHPANLEKRKGLQWFQPHGVLISQGRIRDARRAVNEAALETASDLHHLSEDFTAVIAAEARQLIADTLERGQLDSSQFMTAWWRMVRRLTLGTRARDRRDHRPVAAAAQSGQLGVSIVTALPEAGSIPRTPSAVRRDTRAWHLDERRYGHTGWRGGRRGGSNSAVAVRIRRRGHGNHAGARAAGKPPRRFDSCPR
jgi:hypothetical protein